MNINIINTKANSRDEILREIAQYACQIQVAKNSEELFKDFLKRENIGTTGMEDGIAIPHIRTSYVDQTSIIIARSKKNIENWSSLDKKPITTVIALLVKGDTNQGETHMELLSKVATQLMEKRTREIFKVGSLIEINKIINYKNDTHKEENKDALIKKLDKSFVGVTACATGVVHTFMAQEALMKGGSSLSYSTSIETQGQKGQDSILSQQEIIDADFVIIASDINVDLDRFNGKRVYICKTNDVIKNATNVIQRAEKHATIYNTKSLGVDLGKGLQGGIMKHILSGVSRMIPFIVFSGIVWALLNSLVQGGVMSKDDVAVKAASIGFTFFIAIMGGFIGESIAGRAALAPATIATFVASDPSFWWNWNGIIPKVLMRNTSWEIIQPEQTLAVGWTIVGAILMGFAAGYLVNWMNKWKLPSNFAAMMPILIIPVIATSILVFPIVYIFGAPIGYIINNLGLIIGVAGQINGVNFLIGFILGAMIGFDMGGPVNKIAGATSTALIQMDPRLLGAVEAAIPIAPLGCGLATLIGGKLFDKNEKGLGLAALGLGFFGISEGAIPFAAKRPKITIFTNVISSALAGGLSFMFFVGGHVGMWGGPIVAFVLGIYADPGKIGVDIPSIFGGPGNTNMQWLSIFWFFIAISAGATLHAFLYIFLIKRSNERKTISIEIPNAIRKNA